MEPSTPPTFDMDLDAALRRPGILGNATVLTTLAATDFSSLALDDPLAG